MPLDEWADRIGRQAPVDRDAMTDYALVMLHALDYALQLAAPAGIAQIPRQTEEENDG